MIALGALVFVLVWTGTALLIDAWQHRERRSGLTKGLTPYRRRSVGDEAEAWLHSAVE